MILSLSCLVTLSYSLSHSFSCAGFYKFVVRDDVISPAGVRNFGTYDDVFEHVHSVARVRKNWATVVAYKSGCAKERGRRGLTFFFWCVFPFDIFPPRGKRKPPFVGQFRKEAKGITLLSR